MSAAQTDARQASPAKPVSAAYLGRFTFDERTDALRRLYGDAHWTEDHAKAPSDQTVLTVVRLAGEGFELYRETVSTAQRGSGMHYVVTYETRGEVLEQLVRVVEVLEMGGQPHTVTVYDMGADRLWYSRTALEGELADFGPTPTVMPLWGHVHPLVRLWVSNDNTRALWVGEDEPV